MTSWKSEFYCSNSDVIFLVTSSSLHKNQLVDKNLPFLINDSACTIEAYILQTFHILQNFKSYHKTICSGRFCINLLLLPVLKWVPCGSPFLGRRKDIKKAASGPITEQVSGEQHNCCSVIGNLQNLKKLQIVFYDSIAQWFSETWNGEKNGNFKGATITSLSE